MAAFREALRLDAGSPEAVAGLILARLRAGRAGEALALLDAHREIEDRREALSWLRVEALRQEHRNDEALELEKKLGQPDEPFAWFVIAERDIAFGRARQAQPKAYRRAVEYLTRCVIGTSPARPLFHFELAHAAGRAQDYAAARQVAISIQNLWAPSPRTLFWIGFTLLKADRETAFRSLEEAVRLDPDYAEAHLQITFAHFDVQDFDSVVSRLQFALERRPDLGIGWHNLGFAYSLKGDPDNAMRCFREAVRLRPDFALAHTGVGSILKSPRPRLETCQGLQTRASSQPSVTMGLTVEP
jgi:tetratricopeptide (TPR) repeat protein